MKERKLVRQFTLDTEIYDAELPQKVLSVLRAEPLETDPHFYYGMSIIFDKAVLHHLKPLGFSLFADTAEGLVKVKKQEAAGKRNLNLSWKK